MNTTKTAEIEKCIEMLPQLHTPEKISWFVSVAVLLDKQAREQGTEPEAVPEFLMKFSREQYQTARDLTIKMIAKGDPSCDPEMKASVLDLCRETADYIDRHFLSAAE